MSDLIQKDHAQPDEIESGDVQRLNVVEMAGDDLDALKKEYYSRLTATTERVPLGAEVAPGVRFTTLNTNPKSDHLWPNDIAILIKGVSKEGNPLTTLGIMGVDGLAEESQIDPLFLDKIKTGMKTKLEADCEVLQGGSRQVAIICGSAQQAQDTRLALQLLGTVSSDTIKPVSTNIIVPKGQAQDTYFLYEPKFGEDKDRLLVWRRQSRSSNFPDTPPVASNPPPALNKPK